MSLITVIMPAFNREKEIQFSIRNILKQSYKNFELIIVDDGSTDNTVKVISNFNDPRIRLLCLSKNQGASTARNLGIQNAKGDYITFLDSDDFYKINKLATQLKYLKETRADVVYCGMKVMVDPPHIFPINLENRIVEFKDLLEANSPGTPCIFAKKVVLSSFLLTKN